jgi:hypothetical protein
MIDSYCPEEYNSLQSHYPGCYRERGHHNCAVSLVNDLATLAEYAIKCTCGGDNFVHKTDCPYLLLGSILYRYGTGDMHNTPPQEASDEKS